jgi:hypothetical protein
MCFETTNWKIQGVAWYILKVTVLISDVSYYTELMIDKLICQNTGTVGLVTVES